MRIDAGLISGVMLEFVIMLYYANTTLKPKRNYYITEKKLLYKCCYRFCGIFNYFWLITIQSGIN